MSSREQVMSALFALLDSAYPWVTSSRRAQTLDQVPPDFRPAMFLSEGAVQTYTWMRTASAPVMAAPSITMSAVILVYTDSHDLSVIGATQINDICDAIDRALAPDNYYKRCTLGGLVDHCRIEGALQATPGDLDGDGMIAAPILITLPISS